MCHRKGERPQRIPSAEREAKAGSGCISTIFDQPYAAASGIFDIEVRFCGDKTGVAEFKLLVDGVQQGELWTTSTESNTWQSKVTENVSVQAGDEITVEVRSDAADIGKLDYVQLNYKGEA